MFRRRAPGSSNAIGRAEFTFHEFTTICFFVIVAFIIATTFGLGVVNGAHRIACNTPGWVALARVLF